MFDRGFSIFGVLLDLFVLIVGVTVLWSLVPRKQALEPSGIEIDLTRETRLRAEIQAVATILREPMPSEVYLISAANAAVIQRGGNRRVMLLGLPLLQMLSVSQFRAILAHELAHFYAGDTRLAPWIFKARNNMARVVSGLSQRSVVLSFLTKWVVIALLHMLIVGGLILYWKLFNRITQSISRRQEFRCDELACHMAGSKSLEDGLCNVNRAAATFGGYWQQFVLPVANAGYCPQVTDGFARFVSVPSVAKATASLLEKQMAHVAANPLDSHPPLSARLERARALAIPVAINNDNPAVTLINDLHSLELSLLKKLMPDVSKIDLKSMSWDSVGAEVYIPLWRKQTECLAPALAGKFLSDLPELVANSKELVTLIPDVPGTLPTHEQRLAAVTERFSGVLALTLADHGWHLHVQPGQFYLEHGEQKLEPRCTLSNLKSGKLAAGDWVQFCKTNGMDDWQLRRSAAEAAK